MHVIKWFSVASLDLTCTESRSSSILPLLILRVPTSYNSTHPKHQPPHYALSVLDLTTGLTDTSSSPVPP